MAIVYPDQFLGLSPVPPEEADAMVIPVPFERTVSYGRGTEFGPRAILDASCQIETFDEETETDFETAPRIHTGPPILFDREWDARVCLDAVEARFREFRGKFVVGLGGEHLMTYGAVKGLTDDLENLTVVQIDAHADLADTLDGERWSHGAVMKRLLDEGASLVQIGVRSLSKAEHDLARSHPRIAAFFAHELPRRWEEAVETVARLRGDVYLTVDVDGLDPSLIPSTGTPQPDGLNWRQTMEILRAALRSDGRMTGADVVEFIPSLRPPGCDLIAAKLAVKILAYWASRPPK